MDFTLSYVKESLSNWIDENETAYRIYEKLEDHYYENEEQFAIALDEEEKQYLSELLAVELDYAKQEADHVRIAQLNEMYEQLY
ncbi:uncharacterized protein (UPF0548 family) [Pullulanibacillus pueri]|uniref:Sporulation protein n=1 Tax=Pullulanibacillus pueri TaxID=1437324 RepID=A0A8J2ZRA3_9BACL|nr:sporulation protein [Pullulanibacillus pueri]MBM7680044.1 uncharacterized protein (UPF0548 family) [Pullulanibacillus pueri]GGH74086.1 hypothetical protein GCM10007096_01960 [Pullulanibacillus pueri]